MRQRSANNGAFTIPMLIACEPQGNKRTCGSPVVRALSGHRRGGLSPARTAGECPEAKQPDELSALMVNALSQVSDAVIATDHAHRITYWNKSAEQLYRFTPQEVRGRAIEDVYHHRWLKPLEIESSGKGTTVRAILPLSERHS